MIMERFKRLAKEDGRHRVTENSGSRSESAEDASIQQLCYAVLKEDESSVPHQ
jgi:hypothetical protein